MILKCPILIENEKNLDLLKLNFLGVSKLYTEKSPLFSNDKYFSISSKLYKKVISQFTKMWF